MVRIRKMIALCLSLCVLLSLCTMTSFASSANKKETVTVRTDKGTIRGYRENGINIFKGVPYAKPPVGSRRWKSPEAMDSWSGVKDCTKYRSNAIQQDQKTDATFTEEFIIDTSLGYSEDCLYLNVWSKNDQKTEKPIIVYVHGGGFMAGGASCEVYEGDGLAEKGAVYVNLNYRLGLMGFFSHPDLSNESSTGTSGNYALQDILAALKWIRTNAKAFGGDANNITLVGQSAGSCLTELLACSAKTKGLIKQAVCLSYPQINMTYKSLSTAEEQGKDAAGDATLKELRAMSAEEAMTELGNTYYPIRDGKIVKSKTKTSYLKGTANDIPVLYSSVTKDAALTFLGAFNGTTQEIVMSLAATPGMLIPDAKSKYYTRNVLMANYAASAEARSSTLRSNSYIAYMSYVMPGPDSENQGAFHTSDVPYWLNHLSSKRSAYWTDTDRNLADRMSSYLMNFARTGDPNGKGLTNWPAYDGTFSFLEIGKSGKATMKTPNYQDFWNAYIREKAGVKESAQVSTSKADSLVTKLNDTTYLLQDSAVGSCMYLLLGSKYAMLIDTGYGTTQVDKAVREITDLPLKVVCTHGHFDHVGSNYLFEEVYLNKKDRDVYEFFKRPEVIKEFFGGDLGYLILKDSIDQMASTPMVETKSLPTNGRFELGGRTVSFFEVPGHTPGSIALYDESNNMLFTGDYGCEAGLLLSLPYCLSVETAYESLQKLNRFVSSHKIDQIYPGHVSTPISADVLNDQEQTARDILDGKPTEQDQANGTYSNGKAEIDYNVDCIYKTDEGTVA